MAVKLLQVLVLGVIAAAADNDVPVTWLPPRGSLPCLVPAADRIPVRSPPPPLDAEKPKQKNIGWRRDNEELKSSRVWKNGTLELQKRRDVEGVYQCYMRYAAEKVLGLPVNVKYAYIDKQFKVQPLNSTAVRGQPHVLSCDITSYGPVDISWTKNSKPLVPDDTRIFILKNQLLISEVTFEDEGMYRCKATNTVLNKSRVSHGGRLTVEDSAESLELAFLPHVLYESNILAQRGSKLVLPCPIVGDQKPQLLWEFTAPGDIRTSELVLTQEILVFQSVELDGVYTCRPEGYNHLVKTFNVTVTEPVSITHPPESRQAMRASTVRFNCTAEGKPAPNLIWYKDGHELTLPTSRIQMTVSADDKNIRQLLIRGVTSEDTGIYQCFAQNSVSRASAWAVLNVIGAEADAPGSLRCWPIDASHITLEWGKVHAVIAYTVQTTMPDGRSFPEQPINSLSQNITVASPLTPYRFQVRAYIQTNTTEKRNAASDMSEMVTCQGQGVPVTLTNVGDDGLLVSWQNFYEHIPGVIEWILQYRAENTTEVHNVTLKGHVYNYTLNVSPSTSLQVRLLGTRALPWLEQELAHVQWSTPGTAHHRLATGEVVAVPTDLEVQNINSRNITVQWKCEHHPKYSYLLCVKKWRGSEKCQESYVSSAKVSELEPDTVYDVRVQAVLLGKKVAGEFSPPVTISTTAEDELQYSYISNGIVVQWPGDGVRQVRYSQNLTLPLPAWGDLNVTQNFVKIEGLDPSKSTFVVVSLPGTQRQQVLTVAPPPIADNSNIYWLIGGSVGFLLMCIISAAAVCVWHRRKRSRSPTRSRTRAFEVTDEGESMTHVGGRLANGGGSRDAGTPLLNGHVHITENPSQSKTPNGKVRRGRYEDNPFDLARYDSADVTAETVLDDTLPSGGATFLLDTSRPPDYPHDPHYPTDSPTPYNKLPDDNMNSQLTRVQIDNSKLHPTLQPNG